MSDNSIRSFRELADRFLGRLTKPIPSEQHGELAQLGQSLIKLSSKLESLFEEERLLHEVILHANAGLVLAEILDQIYDTFRAILPFDRMGLALLESEGTRVRAQWGRSEANEVHLRPGFSESMKGSSLERIIETGRPRILNDLVDYGLRHPRSRSTKLILDEGLRSSLTCPLIAMGRPIGFLFFSCVRKDAYRPEHVRYFLQIAEELSIIVEKGRLHDELQRTNQRLIREIQDSRGVEEKLRRTEQELRDANRELFRLAALDGLTGLANRRSLDDFLSLEWRRCQRKHKPLSFVLIDVDFFKSYNDRMGHLAGDECLRRIAAVVGLAMRRPSDLAARYGGEEFALVLADTPLPDALVIAERVKEAVERLRLPDRAGGVDGRITVSQGVASLIPLASFRPADLISQADRALYQAKYQGRNRVVLGSPDPFVAREECGSTSH